MTFNFIFHICLYVLAPHVVIFCITCVYQINLKLETWFVIYSSEAVSFNIICLNVLEGIKPLYSLICFKKYRQETLFKHCIKCDNVKALINTSNCQNLVLYSSKKVQQIAAFAVLFGV